MILFKPNRGINYSLILCGVIHGRNGSAARNQHIGPAAYRGRVSGDFVYDGVIGRDSG